MKIKVGNGLLMVVKRAAAAHFGWASKVPTPTVTLPHLPHLPAAQQVRWFTTSTERRFSFLYSIERLVHSTSSHTVFNGRLNGKTMSIFNVSSMIDVKQWKADSVRCLSENLLSILFPLQNSGYVFLTERVECRLTEYLDRFPDKFESLNSSAIIPEIRHVLKGVLDIFLKYRSDQDFRLIHLGNLYWTGRKVVGVLFREELSEETPNKEDPSEESEEDLSEEDPADVDALKVTFTKMFDGVLPTPLEELLTQIGRKSLPLQYLLDNHYSLMGSQERISYRTYVVRNILEGSVRSQNKGAMETHWKNDTICQVVPPVAWKSQSLLGGTYGSNAKRWSSLPEDPVQYLITARNIAEHHSHNSSASSIDERVTNTYPGHANAILGCIHALNPDLNVVKMKGLE